MTTRTPPTSTRLSRPGAWKNDVEKVRRPCRMSWRWAPAAHAAAAAASALATFIRARPPNVAGTRWVYRTGIVREPRRRTMSSPSADVSRRERRAAPAGVAVDAVEAVLALGRGHAEQHDPARAVAAHPVDEVVVGVEHRRPGARHRLDDDALDVGQLADRIDPAQAEVVAGDVGHDGHVVAVVAEALAQDPAARDLEDGRVHGRVLEDHQGRLRPGHVALLDEPAVDDDAVGRGHARPAGPSA